jgi:hypothetical protein
MAQKTSKKRDANINEDSDIFLSYLNKRVRNNRKKLEQIEDLSKKEQNTLKPEQIDKIKSKAEVLEQVRYVDKIKDMYYEAVKTAQETGKTESGESIVTQEKIEKIDNKAQAAPEKASTHVAPPVTKDVLAKVLKFVHFAQLFTDPSKRDELKQHKDLHHEGLPDYDTFYEFFTKVFTFVEGDKLQKVGSKINTSLSELELYLQNSEKTALKNRSYKYLHDTVEKVAASAFFLEQEASVHAPSKTVHHSAIGSELHKKDAKAHHEVKHEEVKAEEKTHHSPVKSHVDHKEAPKDHKVADNKPAEHKEIPTVEQIEKKQREEQAHHSHKTDSHYVAKKDHHHETRPKKNWADVEDDDHHKEEKKAHHDDDGFVTIQSKAAKKPEEKKPQGGYKPRNDRPYKPRDDKPRDDRPRDDRPRDDRPREDRPRGEKREGGDRQEGGERRQGGGDRRPGNTGGSKPQYKKEFVPKQTETGAKPAETKEVKQ